MAHVISVDPTGPGWAVRLGGVSNDMLFLDAAAAETAARELGERLAGTGELAEIRIRRDGGLARFVCPPRPAHLKLTG